jgi:polyphenol oxidase
MPQLAEVRVGDTAFLTDPELRDRHGILVAFSQRRGGRSAAPYASLNLAAHVGDIAALVDENRSEFMGVLGIAHLRERLTTAEQVHGHLVREVVGAEIGMGAYAHPGGPARIPDTDGLLTAEPDVPLLMLFADCVPVVLVATGPRRAIAVVHSGWRGAYERIAGKAATALAAKAGCGTSELLGYVGPHIRPCHYEVDAERLSHFANRFGTLCAAQGRLDLGAVVSQSLIEVGVRRDNVVVSEICTAEQTESYFSYRAELVTGRHGALAVILGQGR